MVRGAKSGDAPRRGAAPVRAWLLVAAAVFGAAGLLVVLRAPAEVPTARASGPVIPAAAPTSVVSSHVSAEAVSVAPALASAPRREAGRTLASSVAPPPAPPHRPGEEEVTASRRAAERARGSAPPQPRFTARAISIVPSVNAEDEEASVRGLVEAALQESARGGANGLPRVREAFAQASDAETKSELLSVAVEMARRQSLDPTELLDAALREDQPEEVRHAALYYLQEWDPVRLEEIAASPEPVLNAHARGYLREMLINRGSLRAPQELPDGVEVTVPSGEAGRDAD